MRLTSIVLLLGAAPSPAHSPANENGRLATVATVERIPLRRPMSGLALSVDPLSKRMQLRALRDGSGLAQLLRSAGSRICPQLTVDRDGVSLHCRTRQLDGILDNDRGQAVLEIYELRGLPWRDVSQQLVLFYDPVALRLGGPCPGSSPLVRGECALHAGELAVAAVEFRRALNGDGRRMAALRLGDMALRAGEPGTAAGWYQAAGRAGIFGRMATARLCELSGNCFGNVRRNVFDATFLPEPLHTELRLRAARVSAFLGENDQAIAILMEVMHANHGACDDDSRLFCRRIVLDALERPEREGALAALETYMNLPSRNVGELSRPLVRAAAERAAALGAPVFAGNLMASDALSTGPAEPRGMGEHLLRTAELYLQGNDRARARVLCEFADTRLGRAAMTGSRWSAVLAQARLGDNDLTLPGIEVLKAEATRDVATAYTTLARAVSAQATSQAEPGKEAP